MFGAFKSCQIHSSEFNGDTAAVRRVGIIASVVSPAKSVIACSERDDITLIRAASEVCIEAVLRSILLKGDIVLSPSKRLCAYIRGRKPQLGSSAVDTYNELVQTRTHFRIGIESSELYLYIAVRSVPDLVSVAFPALILVRDIADIRLGNSRVDDNAEFLARVHTAELSGIAESVLCIYADIRHKIPAVYIVCADDVSVLSVSEYHAVSLLTQLPHYGINTDTAYAAAFIADVVSDGDRNTASVPEDILLYSVSSLSLNSIAYVYAAAADSGSCAVVVYVYPVRSFVCTSLIAAVVHSKNRHLLRENAVLICLGSIQSNDELLVFLVK